MKKDDRGAQVDGAPRYDHVTASDLNHGGEASAAPPLRPIDPALAPSLAYWTSPPDGYADSMDRDVAVECGWGRILFGQTWKSAEALATSLCEEKPGRRDLALYLRDPHVVVSLAPERLFLDPSHTYRLDLTTYRPSDKPTAGFRVRHLRRPRDADGINRLFAMHHMVPVDPSFVWQHRSDSHLTYLVAEDSATGTIVGTVTGVDHVEAFHDPEQGSSLWTLAVDPQATLPGVGQALVRCLAEHFRARGRRYMDLSVLADNEHAIALYEKLGFYRVPVFCLKHKHNPINEPLYTPHEASHHLNVYARVIVDEARRRGIAVEVLDSEQNYFRLTWGGRSVVCRESLSELTSAVAMSRCVDKSLTLRILAAEGLKVPEGIDLAPGAERGEAEAFLRAHGAVVVKPVDGEQGKGISVDVRTPEELRSAIERAARVCERVRVERLVPGEDLRVVVIDGEVVAAAVRRPPSVVGTGRHTILELVRRQSRRREAATGGESRIPVDEETTRCVESAGHRMDEILPEGDSVVVRKTANLHTGGTIHDVTDELHPVIEDAAIRAARALGIPVVGLDFLVPSPSGPDYTIIEANERPGLANHEPRPTAERLVDFLFPNCAASRERPRRRRTGPP